jgi:small conductance mechanosensitive channel
MFQNLLSGYPAWAVVSITAGATLVLAFGVAEVVARLARLALTRALRSTDPERLRDVLRRPVRVVRGLTLLLMLAVLAVPAIEIAGQDTSIDLHPDMLVEWLLKSGVRIVLIVTLAWLLQRVVSAVVSRLEYEASHASSAQGQEQAKRIRTLGNLVEYVVGFGVTGVATLMVMHELNINIAPVLAGAGIVGLAVGFGAQSIVKDFFSGFFLILEDQVRVGDVAVVNGVGGSVELITLRTITLRDIEGTVHVFPNGSITTLANRTKDYSFAVLDVGVAYSEDVDRVTAVLREVGGELKADPAFAPVMLEPLEVLGVDRLADSAVVIKVRAKTVPQKQWEVARELRRRIKNRFDAEGIEIPFPQMALSMRRRGHGTAASE